MSTSTTALRIPAKPLFFVGSLVITRSVKHLMDENGLDPLPFFGRHSQGDWGDLGDSDKQMNDDAVRDGERIFSAYEVPGYDEDKLYIITEADRSCTTIMLASDY